MPGFVGIQVGWMLFLVFAALFGSGSTTAAFICVNESQLGYTYTGEVSVGGTTAQCLENLQDSLLFPGIMTKESLNVSVQLTLNNLISVQELENTVVFDMLFWLAWKDERLNMPAMWSRLPNVSSVDVSQYLPIEGAQGLQPEIWVPDIFFPNAQSIYITEKYLKLFPEGEIRYLKHMVLTLLQSQFDYHNYPFDSQNVEIKFMPVASGTHMINFYPPQILAVTGISQPAVTFTKNTDGEMTFKQNPLWAFNDVFNIEFQPFQLNEYFAERSVCTTTIQIDRIPFGIVDRLAYPIFLLAIIAGLGFWADSAEGVTLTLTILLAISALYIIIFSLVPFVGYLTLFDRYVTTMFTLLVSVCVVHQWGNVIKTDIKTKKYPLRVLVHRLLLLIGKIAFIPAVSSVYLVFFHSSGLAIYATEIAILIIISVLIVIREFFGMKKKVEEIIYMLESKVLEDGLTLSKQESIVYNLWYGRSSGSSVTREFIQQNAPDGQVNRVNKATAFSNGLQVREVELNMMHRPQE